MSKEQKQTTSIRLSESVMQKITEMAKSQNRNVSNMIETILLKEINK